MSIQNQHKSDDELALEDAPTTTHPEAPPEAEEPPDPRKPHDHVARLGSLIPCTTATALLSGFYAAVFQLQPQGSPPFISLTPFNESAAGLSPALRVAAANANAACVTAIIIFVTLVFVVAFRFRLARTLDVAVSFAFLLGWTAFPGYLLASLTELTHGTLDWLTLAFLCWNFAVTGLVLVHGVPLQPFPLRFPPPATKRVRQEQQQEPHTTAMRRLLRQLDQDAEPVHLPSSNALLRHLETFYLVMLAAAAAWPFACLGELTVAFLLVQLTVWDLLAVLTPCGPLRYIMVLEQQRIWMAEPEFRLPRGMVLVVPGLYELGLGDLVFFGLVTARAAQIGPATYFATSCAIIAASVFTVDATVRAERTIPALPIAMACGVLAYIVSRLVVEPLLTQTGLWFLA